MARRGRIRRRNRRPDGGSHRVARRKGPRDPRSHARHPPDRDRACQASSSPPSPGSHIKMRCMIRGRPDTAPIPSSGPCADGGYQIAVKRLENTTRRLGLHVGAQARRAGSTISAPANHFNLALGRPEYLLLAGGIGVTPIYTHALALAEASARFRLIYACRSRARPRARRRARRAARRSSRSVSER